MDTARTATRPGLEANGDGGEKLFLFFFGRGGVVRFFLIDLFILNQDTGD